ncbi:MAG: hypothetical protein ACYTGI_17770 [Planctomycetota bacterium]|jgi:hypothetical protein
MQRMLVGLVVFLTAAVGLLGVTTYNLSDEVGSLRQRAPAGSGRRAVAETPDSDRIQKLERDTSRLLQEVERLRRKVAARPLVVPAPSGESKSSGGSEDLGARVPDTESLLTAGRRDRDAAGKFVLTDEDEELFLALEKRAQRRRRIESTTRNVMRRIERLAQKGDIQALAAQDKPKVEGVLKRYVEAGDDLITRYLREPTDDIKALSINDRRQQLSVDRDQLVEQAALELAPLLGSTDATAVAEASLQSPWGRRPDGLRGMTGGRLRKRG